MLVSSSPRSIEAVDEKRRPPDRYGDASPAMRPNTGLPLGIATRRANNRPIDLAPRQPALRYAWRFAWTLYLPPGRRHRRRSSPRLCRSRLFRYSHVSATEASPNGLAERLSFRLSTYTMFAFAAECKIYLGKRHEKRRSRDRLEVVNYAPKIGQLSMFSVS